MTRMSVRLYLMKRQGLAGTPQLRFEASYSGSMVPGVFESVPLARSAAHAYLMRRADLEKVRLLDDASGAVIEEVTREGNKEESHAG